MVGNISIIRDALFGGAETKAAEAEAAGLTEGIGEQRRQFDLTREDFAGIVERGGLAGEREAELLGLRGVGAEQSAIDAFIESPGQKFLRERGERAVLRNASATGGLRGGNVLRELQEQGIGFAAGRLGERQDRLRRVAAGGTGAVGTQAGIGANLSSNIARLQAERGGARASGIRRKAAGQREGITRVAQAFI